MASLDWQAQVDQLGYRGDAYVWGNDSAAFRRDIHEPGHPPRYNFLITDTLLDDISLTVRHGPEAQRVECGAGAEILVYDQPLDPTGASKPAVPALGWLDGFRPGQADN